MSQLLELLRQIGIIKQKASGLLHDAHRFAGTVGIGIQNTVCSRHLALLSAVGSITPLGGGIYGCCRVEGRRNSSI